MLGVPSILFGKPQHISQITHVTKTSDSSPLASQLVDVRNDGVCIGAPKDDVDSSISSGSSASLLSATSRQIWPAAGAAFCRDGVSTLAGATARYGVSLGLGSLTAAYNVPLTFVGAIAGAFSGGYVGAGLGMRAALLLPDACANNRCVQIAAASGGALVGAALGAAPSVQGYFTNPGVNTDAVRQIASVAYAGVRDVVQQTVVEMGPRVVWNDAPRASAVTAAAVPYTVTLAAVGATAPYLPPWCNDTIATAVIEGVDGAVGTLIRGRFPDEASVIDGAGRLSMPNASGTAHAALMRDVGSTLVHAQDLAIGRCVLIEQANLAGIVGRLTTVITEYRTLAGVPVQRGNAELFQAKMWSRVSSDAGTVGAPDWDAPPSHVEDGIKLQQLKKRAFSTDDPTALPPSNQVAQIL